jgi:4-hydroxy-3-methylbut-2-enyl diphosphate reductase
MIEKVYLAKPRGFCAGVVMAIQAVEKNARALREKGQEALTVFHAIVHNDEVVSRLEREESVHFVEDLAEMNGASSHDTVVFSAHGVSPQVREEARGRGLTVIDATCPLVTKVHTEARRYADRGHHILLIGDSTRHQEVIGTYGEAPECTTVVSVVGNRKHDPELADPFTVEVPDPEKVVVLTQTTLSVDDVEKTIEILRRRFPLLVIPRADDLCYATKNRQDEVKRIAPRVDLFLIVTSDYSSNGMRLLEVASSLCKKAHRVDRVGDIDPLWLEGVRTVGISSAASTPDDLVQGIIEEFRRGNPRLEVIEEGEWENIKFREPKPVPARP